MAMGLLAHHLAERGMDARVHSAGTIGWGGPATNHAVETLAARGLDLSAHESRRLKGDDVAEADLIIGMTRDHVHGVIIHDQSAIERTFVMGEIVRLGNRVGPRKPGQSVREWGATVAALRPKGRPAGIAADDIADPVGEGLEVYAATADKLNALCATTAALLLPDGGHGEIVDIDPLTQP
jgi:protein-tyrosine phosphatase